MNIDELRHELVLRAPEEIPEWFKPETELTPPTEPENKLIGYAYEDYLKWKNRGRNGPVWGFNKFHLHKDAKEQIKKEDKYRKELKEHWDRKSLERQMKWRWHYADMVIKAMPKR